MKPGGGEFSTGTTGNFQPALTEFSSAEIVAAIRLRMNHAAPTVPLILDFPIRG